VDLTLLSAGYAGEDVGEPGLRIDVVQLRRHDQRCHDSGPIGASLGSISSASGIRSKTVTLAKTLARSMARRSGARACRFVQKLLHLIATRPGTHFGGSDAPHSDLLVSLLGPR
jgi:hypothetical protein